MMFGNVKILQWLKCNAINGFDDLCLFNCCLVQNHQFSTTCNGQIKQHQFAVLCRTLCGQQQQQWKKNPMNEWKQRSTCELFCLLVLGQLLNFPVHQMLRLCLQPANTNVAVLYCCRRQRQANGSLICCCRSLSI